MAAFYLFLVTLLSNIVVLLHATHFRGGIITWRALNTTPSGTTAQILVHQRYAWRRTFFSPMCTATTISSGSLIGSGTGSLSCYAGGNCTSFSTVTADVVCTDFSVDTDYSMGERYTTHTLPLNRRFVVSFTSGDWLKLAIKGNGLWYVTNTIDLTVRPDGILNTSPVTSTLPVIYRKVNVQHVHIIQMSDADYTDTLRCRWSNNNVTYNFNKYDECGSACSPTLPTFTLHPDNCTLVYKINVTGGYYAVALQIEDFYNSTTPTAMSSVAIQFLFYGINPTSNCTTPPSIIGIRPNLACIGTPIGILTNETVIAQVGCPGKTISEFTTSSPIGLIKTNIINPSTGIFTIQLLFTPIASQYGPQGFCAGAIDNTNIQSDPWCITFLVGFTAPNLQTPVLVQGSASPIGTIFANHTIFSIQSKNGMAVNRPGRNGTNIYFNDATLNGTIVLEYDCGWSPNVIYSGSTIIIYAPYSWTPGHQYYVTFDSGATSGTDFCRAESAPQMSPNFWQFDIWNPALSSTTSSTSTPPTTHQVTTRPLGTTTPIANLTTTGIIVSSPTTVLTTTGTTTSTSTTSTETPATITQSSTDIPVISAKSLEEMCQQPVIIGTIVTMSVIVPMKFLSMFALFTKMEIMHNPIRLAAHARHTRFLNRVSSTK